MLSHGKDRAFMYLQFDSLGDGDGKENAKEGLDKARAKSDRYKGRIEDSNKPEPPKVEVRHLLLLHPSTSSPRFRIYI